MMKEKLTVSLVQADLRWQDPEANMQMFTEMTSALTGKTDLILLPEMFTTGFTMEPEKFGEAPEGSVHSYLKTLAAARRAAVAGSYIIRDEGRYYNSFLFVTPTGESFRYDKRHLFRMGEEHLHYAAGKRQVVINYKGFRIKPFVCYDLRFPVWIRSRADADLLVFVANWPASRREVWKNLLTARALENQVYVAGVNRVGIDGRDIAYAGDSRVISPRGEVAGELPENEEGVITTALDLDALKAFRAKFPVHLDADEFEIKL
jgi:predicted amidohydrolase